MECPTCRAENRETARFCRACGARLTPAPAAEQPADGTAAEARIQETEPPAVPVASPPAATAAPDQQATAAATPASAATAAPLAPMQETATDAEPATMPEEAPGQPAAAPPAQIVPGAPPTTAAPAEAEPASAGPGLEPLAPGAIVADRFEIVALLETEPDSNLYAARDLSMCPACGATGNPPGETFCVECGVELQSAGAPVSCRLRETGAPAAPGARAEDVVADAGRFYLRVADQPTAAAVAAEPAPPAARSGLALAVGYASHVGMVRDLDEDSVCVFTLAGVYKSVAEPTLGLFIVADGMGGHEGGEVASKMTVEIIARDLIRRLLLRRFLGEFQGQEDAVPKLIAGVIADANRKVFDLAQKRGSDMGSTVTLALVMDGVAHIANVGDSRTYLYRQGRLRQITADHSLVASLIQAGVLAPEELYTHPDRNIIYRSIGAKATVEVDTYREPLAPGDTLLLCCDGLWEMIRDEGIEEALLTCPDPQAACAEMIRRANLAGGEDNISVIVVRVVG